MRVRLSVARHELPLVKILWDVPPETSTVSKLLEQINNVIPLESDGWGAEDYIVEVQGYECLHYLNPHSVLHVDDEVSIRALQTPDIRARSISGRYQISAEGAHLIDGIAFGKSYLKRPSRPPIFIPPRKRPRLSREYESEESEHEYLGEEAEQLRIESGLGEEDGDLHDSRATLVAPLAVDHGTLRSGKRRKSVSFDESSLSQVQDEDDDSEGEGEDFVPGADRSVGSDESDEDINFEAEHDSGLASDSASRSLERPHSSGKLHVKTKPAVLSRRSPSTTSDSSSDSDFNTSSDSDFNTSSSDSSSALSSDSDSDSDGESGGKSRPRSVSGAQKPASSPIKQASKPQGGNATKSPITKTAPGQGKRTTQARNQRRKELNRLRALQKLGRVDSNVTLSQYKAGVSESPSFEQARQDLLESLATGGVDVDSDPRHVNTTVSENSGQSDDIATAGGLVPPPNGAMKQVDKETSDATSQAGSGRARLDVNSSNRLIFGSLGVRTPQSKAEQQELRAELAKKTARQPAAISREALAQTAAKPTRSRDANAWKRKIILTAVECVDKHIKLSTPPFPFKQRWDPQQRLAPSTGKKRKRSSQYYQDEETTFKGFDGAQDVGLNYDDVIEDSQPHDPARASSATNFAEGFVGGEGEEEEDDLPPLPSDPSQLSKLNPDDIHTHAIIAFKQLEVTAATNWSPSISAYRTAIVEHFGEGDRLLLCLAKRDRPERSWEYDGDGNRVYGKFDVAMADDDDDDDDDAEGVESGKVELNFFDLVEPKLVRPAPLEADQDAVGNLTALLVPESIVVAPAPEAEIEAEATDQHPQELSNQDSMFTNDGVSSTLAELGSTTVSQDQFHSHSRPSTSTSASTSDSGSGSGSGSGSEGEISSTPTLGAPNGGGVDNEHDREQERGSVRGEGVTLDHGRVSQVATTTITAVSTSGVSGANEAGVSYDELQTRDSQASSVGNGRGGGGMIEASA